MTTGEQGGLLAPSDIADLAGVSRAAVSNWRNRMSDFPAPVAGTANKPLFSTSDIETWLMAHPEKAKKKSSVGGVRDDSWSRALWGIANRLRGRVSVTTLAELFVQSAVHVVEGAGPMIRSDVDQDVLLDLRAALATVPRNELAEAVDGVLERTSRAQGKSAGETGFIGSRVSEMLAVLASPMKSGTLYDPACGLGVAMMRAVERGARPSRLIADEIDVSVAKVAAGRARLRQIDTDIRVGDVLRPDYQPTVQADVIVAEPPFGVRLAREESVFDRRLTFGVPPRSNADLFWVQHVVASLAANGIGYVVTPRGSLSRSGPEAEIRRRLLQDGRIRAVVALPGKMLPYTSIPLALWVLGDSDPRLSQVLMIDATDAIDPEHLVAAWLADARARVGVVWAEIPVQELVAGSVDLNPPKWVGIARMDPSELNANFGHSRLAARESAVQLESALGRLRLPQLEGDAQVVSLGDLIAMGAIVAVTGRSQKEVAGLAAREVGPAAVRTGKLPRAPHAKRDRSVTDLTAPGDVLVSGLQSVDATVDETGGHVPIGGVHRLRVSDPDRLDPHYLAVVLQGAWNLRLVPGTGISLAGLRTFEVPLLPLADQRRVAAAFDSAVEAGRAARAAAAAVDEAANLILTAVRQGVALQDTSPEEAIR